MGFSVSHFSSNFASHIFQLSFLVHTHLRLLHHLGGLTHLSLSNFPVSGYFLCFEMFFYLFDLNISYFILINACVMYLIPSSYF